MAAPGLTLFFPCHNEQETIGGLVAEAEKMAGELTPDYEIIVVDDGSSDGSREILRELKDRHPRLRLIFHEGNLGYGAALLSGFRRATKDWVFYTDGDGQYDVTELMNLWSARDGVDWVNGYKVSRKDPWHRILLGEIYRRLIHLLFHPLIRDVTCDFRLIRRRLVQSLELHSTSASICLELVKKLERAGARPAECPVRHYPRRHGRSRFFRPRHLAKMAHELVLLWQEFLWKPTNTSR